MTLCEAMLRSAVAVSAGAGFIAATYACARLADKRPKLAIAIMAVIVWAVVTLAGWLS